MEVGKYFNSNTLYTHVAFCLWFYFLQSDLQFHSKFFCTFAKHPLSPPKQLESLFILHHFAGHLLGFSARPLNSHLLFSFFWIEFIFHSFTYIYSCLLYAGHCARFQRNKDAELTQHLLFPPCRPSAQNLATQFTTGQRPFRQAVCPTFLLTSVSPKGEATATQIFHDFLQLTLYCYPIPLPLCPPDSRSKYFFIQTFHFFWW